MSADANISNFKKIQNTVCLASLWLSIICNLFHEFPLSPPKLKINIKFVIICNNRSSYRVEREIFPARTQNDFCHFVSVRHEFLPKYNFYRLEQPH